MSFGMRIWGPTGFLELDENSFTVRVVYSALVQRSSGEARTRFIAVSGVDPSTHSAVCMPVDNYGTDGLDQRNIQYTPIVTSGGVVLYFGQPGAPEGAPMGVLRDQRLMVVRYR
ncbi:hypothetical protein [Pseudomonas extremaustralis]|uniref:hypothetical protein n=1 Tax=Pseudomonas extremaustralis TaxID=359110 RepID=UPI002AA0DE54|nr:hypothetical protein [Pseudomonas extremaustralis]